MNVAGIIAEYNPFHRGHMYHIERTRQLLGVDTAVVVVMSGSVVQRGEFACAVKSARARMAVQGGADLVLELPAPHACASAARFAKAGVSLLARLGVVTHLSFGSEAGELAPLEEAARLRPDRTRPDLSLARALPALYPQHAGLYTPNNILGMEYLRALDELGRPMTPLTVARRGSSHDDAVASASALRTRLLGGEPVDLPNAEVLSREIDGGRAPIELRRLETAVLSRLRALTAEDFAPLPEMSGGFDRRLFDASRRACTLEELYHAVKSKRFTHARARRAVLCAFLGITEAMALAEPPARLLAIGRQGEALLSRIRVPLLSRPAAHRAELDFEARVTDQICLAMPKPQPAGLEWTCGVEVL